MTTSNGAAASPALQFLSGDSAMARRIRDHDWSGHPFGPPENWPQSLRSALSICLNSAFPTAIYWGPELRLLYNDAWAPIPGPRHPEALGRPAAEVWADIWHVIGPQFDAVLATGEGCFSRDQMLPMRRFGVPEETYWNYSFTPIRDERDAIGGIFNAGNETTDVVLWQRKVAFLLELGEALRQAGDPLLARREACTMLGRHLRADRVGFFEIDDASGGAAIVEEWTTGRLAPLAGAVAEDALGWDTARRFGQRNQIRIDDTEAMPDLDPAFREAAARTGARALLGIPWISDGRLRAGLFAHSAEPRIWTEYDATAARQTLEWAWGAVERARAGERERLMAREIDHRAKNALAVVQAVVRLTRGETVADFRERLEARIGALARSHTLLAAGRWSAVDLRTLVRDEVGPFLAGGGPSVELRGAAFALQPELAQTMALVLHELKTNAGKYGALSRPEGTLAIAWRLTADGALEFDWDEGGFTSARSGNGAEPAGFGSELLVRAVEQQLGGTIDRRWQDGLPRYRIVLPLERAHPSPPAGPPPAEAGAREGGAADRKPDRRPRILIVEDEPLVALELEDRLEFLGYEIFATLGTLSEGLEAIASGRPDGAVLDANLGGESSVPLAELLHERGVPVVFTTGYDRIENLPEGLEQSPLLSKPVADADLRAALRRTVGEPGARQPERADP